MKKWIDLDYNDLIEHNIRTRDLVNRWEHSSCRDPRFHFLDSIPASNRSDAERKNVQQPTVPCRRTLGRAVRGHNAAPNGYSGGAPLM